MTSFQTTDKNMADQFHNMMNNLHPKVKFKIKKPETTSNGHSLSLLDLKVIISEEGTGSFEFYKKTAKNTFCTLSVYSAPEIKNQV